MSGLSKDIQCHMTSQTGLKRWSSDDKVLWCETLTLSLDTDDIVDQINNFYTEEFKTELNKLLFLRKKVTTEKKTS